jgi:hypothetical protein
MPLTKAQATEPVLQGQLFKELESFREGFSKQVKELIAKAVDQALALNIDTLKENFNQKFADLEDSVKSLKFDLDLSLETVDLLKKRIKFLEDSALQQRLHNNDCEQRRRGRTFRVHGKKFPDANSSANSMNSVYNYIIKPSFEMALKEGDLSYIPRMEECSEFGHPLKQRKEDDTPSHIFRFTSRHWYSVFMKYGRGVCEKLNKENNEKVRVGLDLSFLNRKCMSWLYQQDAVYRVRLTGTGLQFSLNSDNKTWLKVRNVEATTIFGLQTAVDPLSGSSQLDD